MEVDERILKLEMTVNQLVKDKDDLNKKVATMNENQVETKIQMTEMRGDIKSLLALTTNLNNKWEKFDTVQKQNANELKMKTIGGVILGIIGFVFAYLKLK